MDCTELREKSSNHAKLLVNEEMVIYEMDPYTWLNRNNLIYQLNIYLPSLETRVKKELEKKVV
jgi:hypothetical protein